VCIRFSLLGVAGSEKGDTLLCSWRPPVSMFEGVLFGLLLVFAFAWGLYSAVLGRDLPSSQSSQGFNSTGSFTISMCIAMEISYTQLIMDLVI